MDWMLQSGPNRELTILLFVSSICFMAYWFTVENERLRIWLLKTFGPIRGVITWFIGNKILGTVLFGIVVTIVALVLYPKMTLASMGLRIPAGKQGWALTIVLTLLLGGVSWNKNSAIAKRSGNFGRYPEIAIPVWSLATVIIHIFFWMIYLLAYEYMFRGVLLYVCIETVGFPLAVGITTALYGIAHVPKGAQEAIGALVLGYVLCVLTYSSGSVFFAWIIHCALAVINGLSAFHYRSDMQLKLRRGR